MLNLNKKSSCVLGIILGIAIIIAGFAVQAVEIETVNTGYIGKDIKFGADFYTEMYDVTKDVGEAVNDSIIEICSTVNNAVEHICRAIGWLIISLGVMDIAFFVYKMCSDKECIQSENIDDCEKEPEKEPEIVCDNESDTAEKVETV